MPLASPLREGLASIKPQPVLPGGNGRPCGQGGTTASLQEAFIYPGPGKWLLPQVGEALRVHMSKTDDGEPSTACSERNGR